MKATTRVETVVGQAPHVLTFDNIGNDSSPDVHEASPPMRVADVPPPPKRVADVPM
jgi:hypothetical protein